MIKVSQRLLDMLNLLPKKTDRVFGDAQLNSIRRNFLDQRKKLAFKLQNPRINQVHLHTFRHWKATMEYHKTKDILYVQKMLGHKSIENTLLYTQLVNFENDDYTTRVSKSLKEDCELIEAGFEFITERDGQKIYRRRK